ncbi:hypothetical protein TD3509T_190029 [Tenacibaculum dicentrarchi]|uniref:Uncharacterized protein n=1 Tax=Tenacibaculum dicentrarchi TaxID=669041 RepID=A0ABP1EI79_9FLAO|nr:hypothetical protein TD3509T_190029 [Tenacibaculum dicentrarchi]
MKKYISLFVHKIVFYNYTIFKIFFISIPLIPIILLSIYCKTDVFYFLLITAYTLLLLFFIYKIRSNKNLKYNFYYLKYINLSKETYQLLREDEKVNFYDTIIKAIIEKDLLLIFFKKQEFNKSQTSFISEINSIKIKENILSEISFERFNNTIETYKGKEWIRDIFLYKRKYRKGVDIILSKLSNHPNTEKTSDLIRVLINNLNLSENGITLEPEKDFKNEIDYVLDNQNPESHKTIVSVNNHNETKILIHNRKEKHIYNEKNTQNTYNTKIYNHIEEPIGKQTISKSLTKKQKEHSIKILKNWFKDLTDKEALILLNLETSKILFLKGDFTPYSYFLSILEKKGHYTSTQIEDFLDSEQLKSWKTKKPLNKLNHRTYKKNLEDAEYIIKSLRSKKQEKDLIELQKLLK